MAWRWPIAPGIALEDMEFVQFHPTTLKDTGILITEGAAERAGYLPEHAGRAVHETVRAGTNGLATRSTVSLAIGQEIQEGRGVDGCVLLDFDILAAPKSRSGSRRSGNWRWNSVVSIRSKHPFPYVPGPTTRWAGVRTNAWGETELPGLFAAGECACVSVHGANRLGGNSLLEPLSWTPDRHQGQRVHPRTVQLPHRSPKPSRARNSASISCFSNPGPERAWQIRDDLGKTMSLNLGIFRTKQSIQEALVPFKR